VAFAKECLLWQAIGAFHFEHCVTQATLLKQNKNIQLGKMKSAVTVCNLLQAILNLSNPKELLFFSS
jgi:hypothetical protein